MFTRTIMDRPPSGSMVLCRLQGIPTLSYSSNPYRL